TLAHQRIGAAHKGHQRQHDRPRRERQNAKPRQGCSTSRLEVARCHHVADHPHPFTLSPPHLVTPSPCTPSSPYPSSPSPLPATVCRARTIVRFASSTLKPLNFRGTAPFIATSAA